MSAQYTPGPWRNFGGVITDGTRGDGTIADCRSTDFAPSTNQANARLIAAAPALLAALLDVEWNGARRKDIRHCSWCLRGEDEGHMDHCRVRAALAQARGEDR